MIILNFNEWGISKKIIAGVILLLLVWLAWSTFLGVNEATQRILDLPEGSITIENAEGEEINISVKIGNSGTSFAGVDPEVIEDNVIYYSSNFPASAQRTFQEVSVAMEIARFDAEGEIKEIHEVPANTETTITPQEAYQHTLIAPSGFFEDNNISVENQSTIQ